MCRALVLYDEQEARVVFGGYADPDASYPFPEAEEDDGELEGAALLPVDDALVRHWMNGAAAPLGVSTWASRGGA